MDYEEYLDKVKDDEYRNSPFIEFLVDPAVIERFPEEAGIPYILKANIVKEGILELQGDLFREIFRMSLTDIQREILKYTLKGLTQLQIANKLGVTQSCIHKAIYGNIVYSGKYKGCRHGGIVKKIRKKAAKSRNISIILEQIRRIKNEDLVELENEEDYKDKVFGKKLMSKVWGSKIR